MVLTHIAIMSQYRHQHRHQHASVWSRPDSALLKLYLARSKAAFVIGCWSLFESATQLPSVQPITLLARLRQSRSCSPNIPFTCAIHTCWISQPFIYYDPWFSNPSRINYGHKGETGQCYLCISAFVFRVLGSNPDDHFWRVSSFLSHINACLAWTICAYWLLTQRLCGGLTNTLVW